MRVLMVALALVAVAPAGCADDDVSQDEANRLLQQQQQQQNNQPSGPNRAPILTLTADNTTGEIPLNVVFTIQAQDVDGQELTFALDADGDGDAETSGRLQHRNRTYEPFTFQYTYQEAGTFTVTAALSDGEANSASELTIEALDPNAIADDSGLEDRGWYEFEAATGMCHVKSYTDVGGLIYNSPLSGGDWYIIENNGVPGLQIENNHPEQTSGFFSLDIPDCSGGDQVAV